MAWSRIWEICAEHNDSTEFQNDPDSLGATTGTFSATKFNTGAQSVRNQPNDQGVGYAWSSLARGFRCQAFMNHAGLAGGVPEVMLFNLTSSVGEKHRITWHNDGFIRLFVNSVEQDSVTEGASGFTPTDTWLQCGVVFWSDASAGFFSFYIGSTRVLTFTGDTGTSGEGIVSVYSGGRLGASGWAADLWVDDMYMDRSTIQEADVVPQTKKFDIAKVNAAGSSAGLNLVGAASNYLAVDDTTPNDDTDYVYGDAAAQRDLYDMTNITVPPDLSVKAVIPKVTGKKTDAGTSSQFSAVIRDVTPDFTVGTATDLEINYTLTSLGRYELDPDGNDWTESSVNAAEFGMESAGSF